jgi:hypothetical protein
MTPLLLRRIRSLSACLGGLPEEAPKIIVDTLKEVGVNFVASLPDASYSKIHELLKTDKHFTYLSICSKKRHTPSFQDSY